MGSRELFAPLETPDATNIICVTRYMRQHRLANTYRLHALQQVPNAPRSQGMARRVHHTYSLALLLHSSAGFLGTASDP